MGSKQQGDEYPVVSNVPRLGDEQAIIPSVLVSDTRGNESTVSAFGDLVIGYRIPDVSIVWNYDINPERAITTLTGTGTATIDQSRLAVSVIGGVGTATVASKRFIVYRAGHAAIAMFTSAFGAPAAGTVQECGAIDGDSGYFLSISTTGTLEVNYLANGSTTTIDQYDFNVDKLNRTGPSRFTINPQAMNIYRISYGYLGKFPCSFEVYGGHKIGWILFHVVDTIDTDGGGNNLLSITDPNLAIKFRVTSDGTADATMYSGSWHGGIVGGRNDRSLNDHFSFDVTKAILADTETFIGAMRVKATYQGKANKLTAELHNLTAGVDGVKPSILRIYENTTITGGAWVDPIGANSIIEINLTATAPDLLISQRRFTQATGKVDSVDHDFGEGELRLSAGDTLTFTAFSANAADITLAGQWDELK